MSTQKQDPNVEVSTTGKPIHDWRTKVNWERIYKKASIVILCLVPFFIKDMFNFREFCDKNNYHTYGIEMTIYAFIACAVFALVRKIFFMSTHNYIYSKILPKFNDKEKELHTQKVQKWAFDAIYYSLTSLYAFVCFRKANWYPISFTQDENDESRSLLDNFPDQPVDQPWFKYFDFFLAVQFGHHIWATLDLVIVRRKIENKYYEWFLHHILATTLIFYSIYFNFITINIAVLIIHDIGDIFIVLFKIYGEFSSKGFAFKYLVFQMIAGWFVSRVYLYPKVIIIPLTKYQPMYLDIEVSHIVRASFTYQVIMLSMLYLLHIYWFGCMITLLSTYVKKQLKEKRSSKQEAYGNEWDYYQYCDAKKKSEQKKKQEQEQAKKQN